LFHYLGNPLEEYVMQFEDGTFLQSGLFHGFMHPIDNLSYGKTDKLELASMYSFEWQLERAAFDLNINEPYKIRKVKITYELVD
jgi:hypothetical protein